MNRHLVYMALPVLMVAMVQAGDRSSIRGIGMARTVNGTARGLAALGVNPANLGMGGDGRISLNLLPFGFRASSELLTLETYNEYFTGVPGPNGTRDPKFLAEADKERILNRFPDGTATSRLDFEIMPAGLAYYAPSVGGIAVGLTEHMGMRMIIPREFLQMILYGLDSAGSTFQFDETNLEAWWWRELNVSYGLKLPLQLRNEVEIYAGIGIKYLQGYGVMETSRYRALISNERSSQNQYRADLEFDYLLRRSGVEMLDPRRSGAFTLTPHPAGTGFGFDLGVAVLIDALEFHFSVTDIGSMSWRRNLVETFGTYDLKFSDSFLGTIEDTLRSAVRGTNRKGEPFTTSLPTKVRIGFVLGADSAHTFSWFPSDLIVALDISQGFNESMGNSLNPRVSFALEYAGITWLPVRTGWAVGDDSKIRWAGGIGLALKSFSLDLSTENLGLLSSLKDFDLYSVALGFRFRF